MEKPADGVSSVDYLIEGAAPAAADKPCADGAGGAGEAASSSSSAAATKDNGKGKGKGKGSGKPKVGAPATLKFKSGPLPPCLCN